jgi:uncharacterized SAM-binding protein YcdF (DUF218 family)
MTLSLRKWRRWFLIATLAGLAFLPPGALYFSELILCVDNGNVPGDVMVVLGGDIGNRSARTLELYERGHAGKILISGRGDCEEIYAFLAGKGIPKSAIQMEPNSRSTKENAEFSVRMLREFKVKRAIVVTSWFHSRRALHCFRHYAPEIEFTASPTLIDRPKSHWPNQYERVWVLSEYVKLLGYWVRYGVRPF